MTAKDRFLHLLGIEPKRLEPIVKNESFRDPGELAAAAARTQDALHKPAPPLEPGRPLSGITTDDLNEWCLRPDYLELRAGREAARQARAETAPAAIINWDISPH